MGRGLETWTSSGQSGTYRNLFVLNRFAPGTAPENGRPFTEGRVGGDHGGSHRGRSSPARRRHTLHARPRYCFGDSPDKTAISAGPLIDPRFPRHLHRGTVLGPAAAGKSFQIARGTA